MSRRTIFQILLIFTATACAAAAQLGTRTMVGGGGRAGAQTIVGIGNYLGGVALIEQTFDTANLPASFTTTVDASDPNFSAIAALLTNGTNNGLNIYHSIGDAPNPACCGYNFSEQTFFTGSGNPDFQGNTITSIVITFDQMSAPTQVFQGTLTQFWNYRENITVFGDPVPEPGTMMLTGSLGVLILAYRRLRM